jgi:NAD(P)-dependent dehydrogenase (short-subunit alcohol dehydrogenase family)
VLKKVLIADFPIEDLDLSLGINVRRVYPAIQAVARPMKDGSRIITIGSNTAKNGICGLHCIRHCRYGLGPDG